MRRFIHPRPVAALVLAGLALAPLSACSTDSAKGGAPTTTLPPYDTQGMCLQGQNVFREIDALDRKKPDYLDQVKKAVDPLDDRVVPALRDDMKTWVAYVKGATSIDQLAALPPDLKVSTQRIDDWWKKNCGKPLINA